ncbi:MAG: hypothetical protein OEY50_02120 [Nitrospinota bacterium]|nr:hypothetical protein [Nitrospinota bacterium]MDH5678447.1 hypothetical protein [Nitrospinota bacterium]MDH5756570.1 hypothetical protein [Nitrospinota bacterium]
MQNSNVAVVCYEDDRFKDSVGSFLIEHFHITPVYLDVISTSSIKRKNLQVFLVNSDALGKQMKYAENFRTVMTRMNSSLRKSIIMLTQNIKVSDFLRNMEFAAVETIDIGSGMAGLKVAVSHCLSGKGQSHGMKREEENRAKDMLE